jgi:ferredoxin-NADP reductase
LRDAEAEVAGIRWPTPDVIEVDLRVIRPEDFRFEAGQWISVPLGPKAVRAWSLASSPTRRILTLAVDVSPGGIGSQRLRGLSPGERVRFKGPSGAFVVNRADPRRALFVAEEIGVVPIRSILLHLHETGYGRATGLIHWARTPARLLYETDFRSLSRRYPAFSYLPVLREPPPGWRGETGELAAAVERLVFGVERLVVYVCGGGEAINAVRAALVAKGMDRKGIKWEKFW